MRKVLHDRWAVALALSTSCLSFRICQEQVPSNSSQPSDPQQRHVRDYSVHFLIFVGSKARSKADSNIHTCMEKGWLCQYLVHRYLAQGLQDCQFRRPQPFEDASDSLFFGKIPQSFDWYME